MTGHEDNVGFLATGSEMKQFQISLWGCFVLQCRCFSQELSSILNIQAICELRLLSLTKLALLIRSQPLKHARIGRAENRCRQGKPAPMEGRPQGMPLLAGAKARKELERMSSIQCKHNNTRWARLALLLMLVMASALLARAGGVTVITHGFNLLPGSYPAWVDSMAQAVTNAAYGKGLASSWYHITYGGNILAGYTRDVTRVSALGAADTAEVVVTVDWSELSDEVIAAGLTTEDIASWLAQDLLGTRPAVGISSPLATRPLHLIGHSRGGSVMLETAKFLGSCRGQNSLFSLPPASRLQVGGRAAVKWECSPLTQRQPLPRVGAMECWSFGVMG
jgi:hypothetical protein